MTTRVRSSVDVCYILTEQRSLDVTEVAPGLYMYEAPMISHRVYIRAQGFRSTAITVGPNSISEEVVMKCKGK